MEILKVSNVEIKEGRKRGREGGMERQRKRRREGVGEEWDIFIEISF